MPLIVVEDSLRSGEEGGGGGGRGGFQVWVTVGRKRSLFLLFRRRREAVDRGGPCGGVVPSYHHIHSCWGCVEWEDVGRGNTPMMYTPQACWTWR